MIVVGHAALDHVYRIAQFPLKPTKVRALEHIESGGGSAANAAVTIARLGGPVEFWSRVGADDTGRRILAGLEAQGIDKQFILVHEGSRSSEAAVIVDNSGERLIVGERDHAMPADAAWLPIDHVSDAAVVLSDLRWFEGTAAAFREARRHGITTVLDIDIGGAAAVSEYLRFTDYAIFSAPALAAFGGAGSDIERLHRVRASGVRHAGVTRGAKGYLWCGGDGDVHEEPACPVAVVDTTGAGDAFHGAFAWALAHGHDETSCAKIACAVAALKCRKLGSRQGLPSLAEVEGVLGRPLLRPQEGQV